MDLFTKDIPHVTLYLADFDLEANSLNASAPVTLNQTKVDAFVKTIGSLNFTSINASSCPLSFKAETTVATPTDSFFSINNDKYFIISGAYTMIPVEKNSCLQHLSDSLLAPLKKFLKMPADIPSWVNELPEEEKNNRVSKIEKFGSPNVLEFFEPHVTVGYDEHYYNPILRATQCPDGQCLDLQGACQPVVNCFADPCIEVPGEKCGQGELCKANFCGGCNFSCESLSVQDSVHGQTQLRLDAMEQWNEQFQMISSDCDGNVMGIAVGKTGLGGTVLANSRLGHWGLYDDIKDHNTDSNKNKDVLYARVAE